jgi:hypothetical protein
MSPLYSKNNSKISIKHKDSKSKSKKKKKKKKKIYDSIFVKNINNNSIERDPIEVIDQLANSEHDLEVYNVV